MKKPFLALLSLLAFSRLSAQEGIHIGGGFIPQSTWITNLNDTDDSWSNFTYKATWGYAGYGKLGYNFGPPLGVHAQVIWSKQGQIHTSQDAGGNHHEIQRDLTYLKIPLVLAISSDEGGRRASKVLFCFGGGPMYAMLLDAKVTDNGAEMYPGTDVKQLFKASHWGGMWYIGADFRVAGDVVLLHARMQGDHSAGTIENRDFVLNGSQFYPANRPKTNNFNIGLNLGISFVIPAGGSGGAGQYWRN